MTEQTIKLKFKEEADLFSSFDPDQKQLSEEVAAYLIRSFHQMHKNSRERYTLQFQFDMPVDQQRITDKCKDYFFQERAAIKRSMRKMLLKAIYLAILGVIILSIWFYLSARLEGVNVEILSIMGWVCVCESNSMVLMGSHDARQTIRNFDKILNAEIVFVE